MKRREFLHNSALAAGAAMVSTLGTRTARAASKNLANDKIAVCVAGVARSRRGTARHFRGHRRRRGPLRVRHRRAGARRTHEGNEQRRPPSGGSHQGFSPRARRQRAWMPSCSARRTIGTRSPRSSPARRARTCTSRSPTATTSSKGARWWPPPRSTIASCSSARRAAAARTFSRRWS